MFEQTTGIRFNSTAFNRFEQHVPRFSQRASVSYVTGSHAFKTGFQLEESVLNLGVEVTNNVNYTLRNGVPVSLTQWATPYIERDRNKDWGVFVQDQWTLNRLTLNYGVRYEYFNGYIPATKQPASGAYTQDNVSQPNAPNGWVPERDFPAVNDAPLWTDINPRWRSVRPVRQRPNGGEARDRQVRGQALYDRELSIRLRPPSTPSIVRGTMPTNRIPDCNLANRAANGECGAMANQNFGGRVLRCNTPALTNLGNHGNN
jgi:hypothetical protein